jgi:toxin ParE1/3/4
MAKVTLRQEAIDDLTDIWEYTKTEWSENQAEKYYQSIKYSCNDIAENPTIGKTYSEISKQLFGLKSGKHIIFYRILSEFEIEVIRILHERMDLKSRLNE